MSADTLNSKRLVATVWFVVAVFASRIAAQGLGDDPASTPPAPGPIESTPSTNSSSGLECYKCEGNVNSTCGLFFDSSKVNKTNEADGFHSCFVTFKGANGTKFKDITDPLEILEKALASITDVERNGAPDKVKHSHLKCDFGSETEITCRCGSKLCNAGSTMDSAIRLVILLIAASLVGQQAIGICGRL